MRQEDRPTGADGGAPTEAPPEIRVVLGDLTQQTTDAIVNAANRALAGGGGVDGAIHQAAGAAELHAACVPLAPCEPGEVRVTAGFRLAARWILHTVGPVYRDGKSGEADVLAACYRQCLETADRMALSSIAFPALSTGVYGYPKGEAARIAVRTLRASRVASVRRIVLVAYDRETYDLLTAALREAEEQS